MKKLFWSVFVRIDARLKFPALRKGDLAIQIGFDMDAPVTSDLFLLNRRVGNTGKVIGIDPDPSNVKIAREKIEQNQLEIDIHHFAISDEDKSSKLKLGNKRGWNQLEDIPIDTTADYTGESISVDTKRLDTLLSELDVDQNAIKHINLTVNGVEYHALMGMQNLLKSAQNIGLTIIAGRQDETGTINGKPDHELITELLHEFGFETRFKRVNQLFWWGFINNLIMHRRWVYGKTNYGIIMASKGKRKLKWYQSFS